MASRSPSLDTIEPGPAKVRFGGRTLRITVHVNTDEDETALSKRIDEYVMTTGCRPLTLTYAQEVPPAVSAPLWARVLEALEYELKLEKRND